MKYPTIPYNSVKLSWKANLIGESFMKFSRQNFHLLKNLHPYWRGLCHASLTWNSTESKTDIKKYFEERLKRHLTRVLNFVWKAFENIIQAFLSRLTELLHTWIDCEFPASEIASALNRKPVLRRGPAGDVTNSTNILLVDDIILDLIRPLKRGQNV